MSDACDHDCHSAGGGSLGIPQTGPFDPIAFEHAVNAMLLACGVAADSVHTGRTAQRVRELWQKRLLGGYEIRPRRHWAKGLRRSRRHGGGARHCRARRVPASPGAVSRRGACRLHSRRALAWIWPHCAHGGCRRPPFHLPGMDDTRHCRGAGDPRPGQGAACIVEAEQLCLLLGEDRRGDERVVTQAFTGCFKDSDQLRNEFLRATSQRDVR